jgi:hypothetical protein
VRCPGGKKKRRKEEKHSFNFILIGWPSSIEEELKTTIHLRREDSKAIECKFILKEKNTKYKYLKTKIFLLHLIRLDLYLIQYEINNIP